jgi:hypothetical protein
MSCSLFIISCSTIFYQPEEWVDDKRVNVDLNIYATLSEMTMLNETTPIASSNEDKDIRITVELYPVTEWNEITGECAARIVTTQPFNGNNNSYRLSQTAFIEPARYSLLVWADFVNKGTAADKYYNTADLRKVSIITVPEEAGFNPQKDAHAGKEVLNISAYKNKTAVPAQTVNIRLLRPFAHYQLWANDLQAYRTQNNNENPPPLTVKTDYEVSFLPSKYDIFAANVVGHHSPTFLRSVNNAPELPNTDRELMLTEDYVLLSQDDFDISSATFTIYRPDNTVLNVINLEEKNTTIQLRRNELTIVKGRYLTSAVISVRPPSNDLNQGGAGIDDRFKGDSVLILPNF